MHPVTQADFKAKAEDVFEETRKNAGSLKEAVYLCVGSMRACPRYLEEEHLKEVMSMEWFGEILFWMHVVIFIAWFGLFLIPLSIWPGRIAFHFWYITFALTGELLMGLLLMPVMLKYRIVCPLTTWMQLVRGYKISDPRNFDHSFVRELFQRLRINIPYGYIGALIFISWGVVIIQYFVKM